MEILIVEDEPSAMRYLTSIIEMRCKGVNIVGSAENGADAFEMVKRLKPDIVITDIKMPIMDGIQLVSCIKKEFPNIYSIIVSGYQDFEYAKGALKSGVVDYLLKPVNAEQLRILIDSIVEKLEKDYYVRQLEIMNSLLEGKPFEKASLKKYLPCSRFNCAIVRVNGLPSRFKGKFEIAYSNTIFQKCITYNLEKKTGIWVLTGRDENEAVFVYTPSNTSTKFFNTYIEELLTKLDKFYYTTVFSTESFNILEIKKLLLKLYRTLDNNIVIGLSQSIHEMANTSTSEENRSVLDSIIVNRISFLVSNALISDLKEEFIKLFAIWEKEKRNQLWIESSLRQIFNIIIKGSSSANKYKNYDFEIILDEALCYSTTFGELMKTAWELVENIVLSGTVNRFKVDTPEYFSSIEKYIEQNISEQLSLPAICSVFGISQTYMSRLFRKYKQVSFNEYLTNVRIEIAKQLIINNPSMNLRDVANIVGYNDQFYFSRVFKTITGMPPSEYQ